MAHVDTQESTLLTVHECATRLRSSERSVRRWIRAGALPALRVGQQYRGDSGELESWLYGDAISSNSPPAGGVAPSTDRLVRRGPHEGDE